MECDQGCARRAARQERTAGEFGLSESGHLSLRRNVCFGLDPSFDNMTTEKAENCRCSTVKGRQSGALPFR
ncbi:hypothetical protein Salmuc_04750 [Salipiger mucosus DSM 16094]|uniref:Uncharacterized protein n=1 Tax=Salipiger mucosus DSM 16094 TaxID=1123237 RepID=S9QDN1_9RHOB|nr:hypothetical protein Salmuc_04750 [Salipiger mucosus DSM 16094]